MVVAYLLWLLLPLCLPLSSVPANLLLSIHTMAAVYFVGNAIAFVFVWITQISYCKNFQVFQRYVWPSSANQRSLLLLTSEFVFFVTTYHSRSYYVLIRGYLDHDHGNQRSIFWSNFRVRILIEKNWFLPALWELSYPTKDSIGVGTDKEFFLESIVAAHL